VVKHDETAISLDLECCRMLVHICDSLGNITVILKVVI